MNKKGIYILVAVVIVLLLIIWAVSVTPKKPATEQEGEEVAPEAGEEVLPEGEGEEVMPEEGEEVSEPEVIESPLGEFNPEDLSQTAPLEEEEIPEDVIKIKATPSGFEPSEFTVKAGEVVSITVTGVDATHVFKFESPELSNVAIGVANGETRGISFIAPEEPGDYVFYCDVPGHRARGEQGVMHVE
ncbi:cupredoxin domain-containing protein [bacterium]|nr:cupredoxin domain-containing protein [bacterium]